MIPATDHFDEVMASAMISDKYSPAIRSAMRIGKNTLNRYYSKTDYSEMYRVAMGMLFRHFQCFFTLSFVSYRIAVLDPRYKLSYFRKMKWETGWITEAHEIVKQALSKYSNPPIREEADDVVMVQYTRLKALVVYLMCVAIPHVGQ